MSIQLSGGTYVNDLHTGAGATDQAAANGLLADINTSLTNAGWASTAKPAMNRIAFTGLPSDAQTVTLDATVYRFKTTMAAAYDVQLEATAAATWANFVKAVNASGTPGTEYYTGTAQHPTISAADDTANGNVYLYARTAGTSGNNVALAESTSNAAFSYTSFGVPSMVYGGYVWRSPATPQGLRLKVRGAFVAAVDGLNAGINFSLSNDDESVCGNDFVETGASFPWTALGAADAYGGLKFRCGIGSTVRVIGAKYQFVLWDTTAATTNKFKFIFASVPWIPDAWKPKAVTDASNTTPIVITSAAHGFSNGATVIVREVGGNTAARGEWTITYIDANTFSLDGSVGNAAYSSGGICGRTANETVELGILAAGGHTTGAAPFLRGLLAAKYTPTQVLFNNTLSLQADLTGSGNSVQLGIISPGCGDLDTTNLQWHGGDYIVGDAPLFIYSAIDSGVRLVGQLWNLGIIHRDEALATPGTFLGENWYVISDTIATDFKAGVAVVVP